MTRDFITVWVLPVAVLLPPFFAMITPAPLYVLTQWRVHHGLIHRKVFTASCIGLAYGAVSLTFRSVPAGIAGQNIGIGTHALTWALTVAACEFILGRGHTMLLLGAIKLSDRSAKVLQMELNRESQLSNIAESDLGIVISLVVASSPWLSIFAIPMIMFARRFIMHAQLVAQTRVDAKTGLLNSSAWEREAGVEIQRALRTGSALSVALVDIDHFKDVNDTHGHLVGDVVLRAVTDEIQGNLRIYDLAGRFGGEEFVVLLPHAGEADAVRIAERLRVQIAALATPISPGASPVPVSAGPQAGPQAASDSPAISAQGDPPSVSAPAAGSLAEPAPYATVAADAATVAASAAIPASPAVPTEPANSAVASSSGQSARQPGGVDVPSTTPRCDERHIHSAGTAAVAAGTRSDAAVPVTEHGSVVGTTPARGVPDRPVVRVTVSIGVAAMDGMRRDLGALMAAADAALYQAKQAGRNRTRVMPSVAGPAADVVAAPVGAHVPVPARR